MPKSRTPNSQTNTLILSVLVFCTAGLASGCTKPLSAGWTPVQFAFFNPLQVFVEEDGVRGARVNAIYGHNADIVGVDIGFIGVSESMTGLQVNAGFSGPESLDGVQISSLNETINRVRGVQIGGVFSHAEEVIGLQLSGTHNRAEVVTGAQITGMVNETERLTGAQIGLINCNWSRPFPFQCIPFMSMGFAGASGEVEDEDEE